MGSGRSIGPVSLTLAGFPVRALSVGGIETCYELPSLDLCFDIGRCPPGAESRSRLFLTHGHIDHAAGLPYYVSLRGLLGASPPAVFCPAPSRDALAGVLAAWGRLDSDAERCRLVPLAPGDAVPIKGNLVVRAFAASHRIATLGYAIVSRLRRLKPEFSGWPADRLGAEIRAGVEVADEVERAELCFPGDTRIEVVEREPLVRTARVLLLECTFLGAGVDPADARRGGHVHLDQIAERADLFENETIVLTHFSRRYSREEIERELARLPARLAGRVVPLL